MHLSIPVVENFRVILTDLLRQEKLSPEDTKSEGPVRQPNGCRTGPSWAAIPPGEASAQTVRRGGRLARRSRPQA